MLTNSKIIKKLESYGTCLVINTQNIENNYYKIKSIVNKSSVALVLKNNAYGIGIIPMLSLAKKVACNEIFVSTLLEGIEIRKHLDNSYKPHIYVLNPILPYQNDDLLSYNLTPTLNTLSQVLHWDNFSSKQDNKLRAILHIETGINRFGLQKEDIFTISNNLNLISNLQIDYIISHFATASIHHQQTMEKQYLEFMNLVKYLPKTKYSISASDGIFINKKYHLDMVRPAIALYGAIIADINEQLMSPVIHLYSSIQQVKTLKSGEKVGYGHNWISYKPSKIGVISLGYADGVPRSITKNTKVYISGYFCPIIGTMSMDITCIDISSLPPHLQKEGTIVEIMGSNISLEDLSLSTNYLDCDILNRLTTRYPRIYI